MSASAVLSEQHVVHAGVRSRALRLDGDGLPIVLLHGFADSADTWRPLLRELRRLGRAAVAVDLPYFGQAERPRRCGSLLKLYDAFVEDLVAVEDRGRGVVLVGSSLGGLVALRAGGRGEPPISEIVVIGPAGLGLQPWVGVVHRAAVPLVLAARAPVPTALLRAMIGQAYERLAVNRPLDDETRRRFASHLGPGDLHRVLGLGRAVLSEVTGLDVLGTGGIEVPGHCHLGPPRRAVPTLGRPTPARELPGTRLVVRDDAGHCVHLDEPGVVAEAVAVRGCGARGTASRQLNLELRLTG